MNSPKLRIFFLCFGVIVIAVCVNVLAVRFDRRWDVTQMRSHTLSSQTKEFLSRMSSPLSLTVFYSGVPERALKDLLERYEEQSRGMITAEIIDPVQNIGRAAEFDTHIDARQKRVFVRGQGQTSEIDFTREELTEDLLNYGILRVSRGFKKACFSAGHGEFRIDADGDEGLLNLTRRLGNYNILSEEMVLSPGRVVPESCDLLVIAGPHKTFGKEQEQAVKDYLDRGGDALILVENVMVTTPDAPLTDEQKILNPSLNNILNPWGLKIGDDIVVDLASHVSGDVGTPATRNYGKHPGLTKNLDYTFYLRPRSITMLDQRDSSIKLAPFVMSQSKKDSWAETNRMLQVKFDEGMDISGPVNISFVVWRPKSDDHPADTRMIVFTDADFLTNAFLDQLGNAQMADNVFNWLLEPDENVPAARASSGQQRLLLTSRQRWWTGCFLILTLLMVALVGWIAMLRRRT